MTASDDTTLSIVRRLLEPPTAPFHEHAVLTALDAFAAERSDRIEAASDAAGNRIWRVGSAEARRREPVLAFTAHVDHPALVKGDDGRWELLGRVTPPARIEAAPVRFYKQGGAEGGTGRVARVHVEGKRVFAAFEGAPQGAFAMFDLPPLLTEGDLLVGRVCDDLMGAASILLAIELDATLAAQGTRESDGWMAIFTRAEEVGFVGALALLESSCVPRGVPLVGIECSAARGGNAVIGDGPIVRAGDRLATFDPDLTAYLRDCAEALTRKNPSFRYQRRLMQGGACESTAYHLDGRRAGALCLALGNYHNIPDAAPEDPSTGVAPEHVSRRDLEGLAQWIVECVRSTERLKDPWAPTRRALAETLASLRHRL